MSRMKLRESIAVEAARLIVRRKERDFATARKRAARWLSRRRLKPDDLPTNAEIQSQVYALAGLFADETQPAALREMREAALSVMELLADFGPRVSGCAVDGPVMIGSGITLHLERGTRAEVAERLRAAKLRRSSRIADDSGDEPSAEEPEVLHFHFRYPCEVHLAADDAFAAGLGVEEAVPEESLDLEGLRAVIDADRDARRGSVETDDQDEWDRDENHPDLFPAIRLLLSRLEEIRLHPVRHPEGDALYHTLQVFELGLEARPYDEEFLLACLLHDAGLAIDRRHPVDAVLAALDGLLTPRTCFLIEHRREAADYLKTGRMARSLRRSEHFDDLVLLARCDRDGRVPGARVSTLDEALETVESLESEWDDA